MGYFRQALTGTGWMGALRLITRGLGFVKIAILARILTPRDFGLFGIAAVSLALLETFTEPGVSLALVQQEEEIDEYLSTAWLISIARGLLIAGLMLLFSNLVVAFFNQPDALGIIRLSAAIPLVRGFLNPAAVNFVKKLEFNKEFVLRSIPMTLEITSSILLALYLRSPIAIVYGMLLGAFVELILTFTMTNLRPALRFVKSHAAKLIGYGKWVTLGWIMGYLAEQFDDILVGRMLGTVSLGIYQMAFKLSVLPSTELSEVISKVIFPVYSKIAADKDRLKKAVFKTTGVLVAISLPITAVVILFPETIVRIALGEQWLEAVFPLRILALYGFIRSYAQGASAVLYASGRPDIAAKLRSGQFAIMTALLFPLIPRYELQGAAIAVVASAILFQPALWLSVRNILRANVTTTDSDHNRR